MVIYKNINANILLECHRFFHFGGHDEKAKNIKNRRVHDCGRHDPWATVGSQSFPVCWIVSYRIHSNKKIKNFGDLLWHHLYQ